MCFFFLTVNEEFSGLLGTGFNALNVGGIRNGKSPFHFENMRKIFAFFFVPNYLLAMKCLFLIKKRIQWLANGVVDSLAKRGAKHFISIVGYFLPP